MGMREVDEEEFARVIGKGQNQNSEETQNSPLPMEGMARQV